MSTACKQTVPVTHGDVTFLIERISRLQFRYHVRWNTLQGAAHSDHVSMACAKRKAYTVAAICTGVCGSIEIDRIQTLADGTTHTDLVWRG
jgi:hypothetical protein